MKKIASLASLLLVVIIGTCYLHYNNLEEEALVSISQNYDLTKKEILQSAKESVKGKNLFIFEKIIQNMQIRTPLKSVKIIIKKHILDDTLFLQSNSSLDTTWTILEVATDARYGVIQTLSPGVYEIIPNRKKDLSVKEISIRFQAIKNSVIKNFLFTYAVEKEISVNNPLSKKFKNTLIEDNEFTLSFDYDMEINYQNIWSNTYNFLFNILIISLSLLIISILIYNYFIKPKFYNTLSSLNFYLKSTLDGKITKDSQIPKVFLNDFNQLHGHIVELTKKYVNISNELSISKDIILQKEKTDELTGLPNKKSFENDLKHMFVANKTGYIIQLKIDKIGVYTQNHGSEIVDSLIEDFAHTIKKFFNQHTTHSAIYRFFSGEFAMIIYESDSQKIKQLIQNIIDLTKKLSDKFYFFDNTVYYGAIAFDQYGSIESILQSAQDAYQTAFKEKSSRYFVADTENQLELNQKLENTVKDIISRNDFVIQYLYDTYSFKTNPTLLMQEISPLLIDSFTFESIPSGKFVSVAEKLGYMSDFDKALIEKVIEQINFGELSHKICIVLSVTSLSNNLFLGWLRELLETNPYAKQIIFTAPGYSIASNYDIFLSFSTLLKECGHEFMIKRYDTVDLPLDKLGKLSPTYLRLERTLCQDFKKDSTKQHAVKQILLFSEEHNIKILGDSVKNEDDYLAFEMLGFYGTSR